MSVLASPRRPVSYPLFSRFAYHSISWTVSGALFHKIKNVQRHGHGRGDVHVGATFLPSPRLEIIIGAGKLKINRCGKKRLSDTGENYFGILLYGAAVCECGKIIAVTDTPHQVKIIPALEHACGGLQMRQRGISLERNFSERIVLVASNCSKM